MSLKYFSSFPSYPIHVLPTTKTICQQNPSYCDGPEYMTQGQFDNIQQRAVYITK
jgi:hypothetical protein